jgi:ABC-type branched-subunit amino acid transport system substrate-binding protein
MSDLVSQLGLSRVAVLTSSQEALLGLRSALLAKPTLTRSIVFDEEIAPGDVEIFSLVTRMIGRKPDVVIGLTLPPQSATLAKLLKNQGYSGRLLVGPPTYNFSEIKAANGALGEALLVGPKSGLSDAFFKRYQEHYGEPSVAEGMYGYDGAKLLIDAAKSGDISEFIRNLKSIKGSAGWYPINADNLFEVPAEIKVITRGGDVATYRGE